jgi:glycosyltransferase involved in cell wall biosynthesis
MTAAVVITSYNQRAMLAEAIGSALAQTHPPHEVIVADDGSSDGSPEMIEELTRRHPGLVRGVYQPHNVGISRNRNAALDAVTSDWVSILDGDDLLDPRFLERLLEEAGHEGGAGAVYANHTIENLAGETLRVKFDQPQPCGDVFAHIATGGMGIMRAMVVRTDLMRRVGGMDPRFPKHDGFVFTLRLARLTSFAYVHESLVIKREHSGGDSKTFDDLALRGYLGDLRQAVQNEIVGLAPAERDAVMARWDRRIGAVDARLAR